MAVTPPSPDSPASGVSSAAAARHILVIDDSLLIREAAKIALETVAAWRVSTAAGGEEGIALAVEQRPDAILLDVVMPDMDGVAVAERLHVTPSLSSVPIVLLTAKDRPEDRQRFRQAPVRGVIAKPFEIASLSHQLGALLGWSEDGS
jgi:CheY-like chemotaxis protein